MGFGEMIVNANSMTWEKRFNGRIIDSGFVFEPCQNKITHTITNIETFNDKVTQVTFSDGEKVKSICGDNDVFNLEQGISICIAKKLVGGTKEYNDMMRKALKFYEQKERKKIEAVEQELQVQHQKEKAQAKRERYLQNRNLKRKEKFIKMLEDSGYEIKKKKK